MSTSSSSPSQPIKCILADRIHTKKNDLDRWFQAKAALAPPPFYTSVDIRDSGFKIAPVDNNLFPAGFNNICPADLAVAPGTFRTQIENEARRLGHPKAPERIALLPEGHTQNLGYLENVSHLLKLLEDAGFEVRLTWPDPVAPTELKTASGKTLHPQALRVQGGVAEVGDFVPDLILLNNDFSAGYPPELDAITQPILPSHRLGWHTRKKSEHFLHYNRLAGEVAPILDVDPWTLQVATEEVRDVGFNEGIGLDRVAAAVDRILSATRSAYERHGVTRAPAVFIKNNAGTYGMGIMVAHSADDVPQMNRRVKNKMSVGKGRSQIQSVIVQEGVPTITQIEGAIAEPVIYLVGCQLIGGFFRANLERGDQENLNAQGMVFKKMCMADLARPGIDCQTCASELVYGLVGRLSALATGLEVSAERQNQT